MKSKTISSILSKKFDAFVASVTDEALRKQLQQGTIITGGCIVSLLLNENVNDYDLYFRDEATALAVAQYYVAKFKATPAGGGYDIEALISNGRVTISVNKSKNVSTAGNADAAPTSNAPSMPDDTDIIEVMDAADNLAAAKLEGGKTPKSDVPNYTPLFLSSNAITLSTKVQLIIRFYGEPDAIHENYDFVHCTNYWTSWNRQVILRPDALEAILTKELRYVGSKYPICSAIRTRKFLSRGWTINAGQFVKMAWQIHALDLTNIEVLKDQLVGVDSAYFNNLIYELQKKADETDQKVIDGSYLMTLIDKIF